MCGKARPALKVEGEDEIECIYKKRNDWEKNFSLRILLVSSSAIEIDATRNEVPNIRKMENVYTDPRHSLCRLDTMRAFDGL